MQPYWFNKTQLHQANLLITELDFWYSGMIDADEYDQKLDTILDWEFYSVYQDCGLIYAVCCEAQYHCELPDNCTLNDVMELVRKAKKLITLGAVNPENGIQLELFPFDCLSSSTF